MAKEKFDRSKPHVNVGTIGHIDHGKTTLTAAITKVLQKHNPKNHFPLVRLDRQRPGRAGARHHDRDGARGVRDGEPALRARRLPRPRRLHQEHDHRRCADGRRDSGGRRHRRPMPQTKEHVLLARQVGVPYVLVFLNKCDAVEDTELIDLVEMEVRELLTQVPVPGRRRCGHPRLGPRRAERRSAVGSEDRRADGSGRQAGAAAGACHRSALPDADRRHLLDLGTRHGGHGPYRARQGEGGRGSRDRRLPRDAQDRRHGRRNVQEAAGRRSGGRQRGPAAARHCEGRRGARHGAGEAGIDHAAHEVQVERVRVCRRKKAAVTRRSSRATVRSSTSARRT